jgi:hypothetical protein
MSRTPRSHDPVDVSSIRTLSRNGLRGDQRMISRSRLPDKEHLQRISLRTKGRRGPQQHLVAFQSQGQDNPSTGRFGAIGVNADGVRSALSASRPYRFVTADGRSSWIGFLEGRGRQVAR